MTDSRSLLALILALLLGGSLLCVPSRADESPDDHREKALQGDGEAQYRLGLCHFLGTGTEENDEEAFAWFTRAAEQDHPLAHWRLGQCFLHGLGVPQNTSKGRSHFLKAIDFGSTEAMFDLGVVYERGTGVEVDLAEAASWYRKAAEGGHVAAMFSIGFCLEYGEGVESDRAKAMEWYEKAIEKGHREAMNNLALCLLDDGDAPSRARAFDLMRTSAELGNGLAASNLGRYTFTGAHGISVDREAARGLLVQAAELGSESGKEALRDWFPGEHLDLVDGAFDLHIPVMTEPLLLELELESRAELDVKLLGVPASQKDVRQKASFVFRDERVEGDDHPWYRTILSAAVDENGQIADPETTGAVCRFQPGEGGRFTMLLGEDRQVSTETLAELLAHYESVGLPLALSRTARPGEPFEAGLEPLMPFLTSDPDSVTEARGRLVLESFDAGKKTARVTGTADLLFVFDGKTGDAEGEGASKLDLVLDLDLGARRLTRMEAKGTMEVRFRSEKGGVLSPTAAVNGTVTSTLVTSTGNAVERATKARARVRDVARPVPACQVVLDLPSLWFDATGGEETVFVRSSEREANRATLALQTFSSGSGSFEEFVKGVDDSLASSISGKKKLSWATGGLGKARQVTFEQDGMSFLIELHPLSGNRALRVRLYGPPAGFRTASREYNAIRRSLRELRRP